MGKNTRCVYFTYHEVLDKNWKSILRMNIESLRNPSLANLTLYTRIDDDGHCSSSVRKFTK